MRKGTLVALGFVAACGSSALPDDGQRSDASAYSVGSPGAPVDATSPFDAAADGALDGQPSAPDAQGSPDAGSHLDATFVPDAQLVIDASPDGAPPLDANVVVDAAEAGSDASVSAEVGSLANDASSSNLDASSTGIPDVVDAATKDATGSDALLDAGAPALATDSTFTFEGVTRGSYSLFETHELGGGAPSPVRVYRLVMWSDTALTEPLCTVARQTKKAGSREVMVEIHRNQSGGSHSLPVGAYVQNSSGPDGLTANVNVRYYQYGSPMCTPTVETGDVMMSGGANASVNVTLSSASQISATFSANVDMTKPPSSTPVRKTVAGAFVASPYCAGTGQQIAQCSP